jgi:ATP-dependent RNA circularization protein (DNA/RNA ligase family)
MFESFNFCLPTRGIKVPDRPEWIHEVKYDGYCLRVERDGERVQLITRGGYDWTKRYSWVVEAALKNRHRRFVIDGEAVISLTPLGRAGGYHRSSVERFDPTASPLFLFVLIEVPIPIWTIRIALLPR